MLKVAPVSTKYLSLVDPSVKKIKPAFAGKCTCVGKATEPKELQRRNAPVSPIGVVIVKFTHGIARVLK
jgi:hypothetical protein